MATLQIQIVSANGTSTKTLTYSGPDAQRIFTAWQSDPSVLRSGVPTSTQDDFANWLGNNIAAQFIRLVNAKETVVTPPIPPAIT